MCNSIRQTEERKGEGGRGHSRGHCYSQIPLRRAERKCLIQNCFRESLARRLLYTELMLSVRGKGREGRRKLQGVAEGDQVGGESGGGGGWEWGLQIYR